MALILGPKAKGRTWGGTLEFDKATDAYTFKTAGQVDLEPGQAALVTEQPNEDGTVTCKCKMHRRG